MGEMAERVGRVGRRAHHHEWFDRLIRVGLVAYGVVHLLVGWLALQLALGDGGGSASSSGAMQQLVEQPFGTTLLWLVAIGMFVLVLWRLLDAALGHQEEDGAKLWARRGMDVLKAGIYGAIGVSALKTAMGSTGGGGGTDSTTKKIMDLPAGQVLVVVVGLAIIAYGGNLVRQAWNEKFREKLDAEGNSLWYVRLGKAGYNAKGVAFGIVGGLFVYAGLTHQAKKSGGLDRALKTVLEQPFGPFLLVLIAVGIICYGLFSFARARHLSR